MGESIDYRVLRPMIGRSRGDWNPTVEDIAESAENAVYWAIFGITPRGIWHCLGQFPTKQAAEDTLLGKPVQYEDVE